MVDSTIQKNENLVKQVKLDGITLIKGFWGSFPIRWGLHKDPNKETDLL
jgi:hypothetical protein